LEIIGVWEGRKRLESSLRSQIIRLKEAKEKYLIEKREMKTELRKKLQEEREKATNKERARSERLAQMLENKTKDIQLLNRKIRELQEQLKRGTSPQIEGINLEEEMMQELGKEFPQDTFNHYGKNGDILQTILHKKKTVGKILYECKRTDKYHTSFIDQVKKAMIKRNATYGVLVTTASKRGTAGIWVEDNIIAVHPYGAIYVAHILRQSLIEITEAKLTKADLEKRANELIRFIQSDEFKNIIEDCIYKTKKLCQELVKEYKYHRSAWKLRYDYYVSIHNNINRLQLTTSNILNGTDKEIPPRTRHLELPPPIFK